MRAYRLFMAEDDARLGALVAEYLSDHGFDVTVERRGDHAVDRILTEQPDLVILDLLLPGVDGFEVFRRIRCGFRGRVLFLTARRSDMDEVAGLEMGADDFVTKPVEPRVLLARINAVLRRSGLPPTPDRPTARRLTLDRVRREAWVGDVALPLTAVEFDLLEVLARHAGQVVSRATLYECVLGTRYDGVDRGMDVHVSRVRKKLKDAGLESEPIKAVRGTGYQLVVPAGPSPTPPWSGNRPARRHRRES